ncbi:MAG: double-cubane-cluster-containing anaerobic reductase, partial [Syntrophomonadaceae bacterium]|nr:double-cubane-cluster-containing anaerobic reductase [Syntrophomonadaceae bacterium]
ESFSDIREKNILVIKEAKEKGVPVVGIYCTYCPRELVLAAGGIPVGLCGTSEKPIAAAEEELPRNLCPLIKSSYGFAATETCPYFHFSDFVIGETTCDGKKKMFELMNKIKKVHVMQLPQHADHDASLQMWYEEMKRLKAVLEEELNVEITDEKLWEAIHVVNEGQRALQELFDLNKARPAVISGLDMLKVSWQLGFHADRWERVAMLEKLVADFKEMAAQGHSFGNEHTPRILLTGTPVGLGSEKVIKLIEECGGVVIAMENCGGYKTVGLRIDENDSRDPLLLLAEKYISIPCSVMSPNSSRLDLLEEMIEEFQVDGVLDLTWQACHTYNVESFFVADVVKNKLQMPFLQLETDYSQSDIETLRVRIQAFLEMI